MHSTSIISGGSRGLGLAIVERLLERGDEVATFSRSGSAALDALAASSIASRSDSAGSIIASRMRRSRRKACSPLRAMPRSMRCWR
jgi:NAD(P)-dependent dehydrogenase (short-subunit alcohol dehydrogenase family)